MDLRPYIDTLRQQLAAAAEAGGDEARALAERLTGPLDAAMRLALQDVLAAAAAEITCELAPGSVELRLRGRDPEFVVTPAPADAPSGKLPEATPGVPGDGWSEPDANLGPPLAGEGDDADLVRINLRMPDHLKARVEAAAHLEGLSVNAWLVRVAAAAIRRTDPARRPAPRSPWGSQHVTGWAR
jgi:hypothetical protein